ncbi:unnamed protein product [Prunus armeniaca]|uniref:BED-type domain-containing protein n=1 Tax=Prunus armeniaca TaxID=36596 RepID=A0A6J5THW7_PRUAR|nr:unnamed protein product [Prunus armeniaca]
MSNASSTPTPTSAQTVDISTNANLLLPPLNNLKRKAAARSNVWEHFDKLKKEEGTNDDEPRCICKYCEQDYGCDSRNGTSSLWYHLKTKCRTSPLRDVKSQKLLSFVKEDKGSIVSWSFSKERSRLACAQMIIRDELPFSHVENVGFRDLMQEVQP